MRTHNKSSQGAVRMDMLHGSLLNKILLFSLPLAASSILQQLFNSVDVAVVGRFASDQALAAVGSNSSVISLMINLFVGISVGANVVIANYIGQKDERGIKNAIHTVSVIALTSGCLLLVVGLLIARPILEAMDTPDDVIDLAVLYLRIYFLGMPFFMVYNFGASILRSMGDTKRPLYCLVAAGIINTVLNLLLVIVFKMSVAGVAIGTVVANMFSAGVIIYILRHEQGPFKLDFKHLRINRPELRKVSSDRSPRRNTGDGVFDCQHFHTSSRQPIRLRSYCRFCRRPHVRVLLLFRGQCFQPSRGDFHQPKLRGWTN